MNINELCRLAHDRAVEAGWYDGGDRNPLEIHMLIVSEIAEATEEATEEVRRGKPPIYVNWEGNEVEPDGSTNRLNPGNLSRPDGKPIDKDPAYWEESLGIAKPEGELIELADAVIRIADWCGKNGWDLEAAINTKMAYNATRGHRHGGKLA